MSLALSQAARASGAAAPRTPALCRLLPAETRSFELCSAGAMFLCGAYFALARDVDPATPGLRTLDMAPGAHYPAWAAAAFLLAVSAAHIASVVAGDAGRRGRVACNFAESLLWSYAAASALGLGSYPPGGAPAFVYAAMAFSAAWAFLVRLQIWERGEPRTVRDLYRG